MNYSRAFTYMFEDKDWLSKILIAGLIFLIPIIGQFYLLGWMIEIIRRVKAGRTDILPTTHFSYFLTLGLKMFVVCLIYSIPLIIITFLAELISSRYSIHGDGSFTIVVSSIGFFGSLIILIVRIAVSFLSIYGIIKLAETDQIKSCLSFSDAYKTIKNNLTAFIVVGLLIVAANIIASAGLIVCFIGIIFTIPYASAITGHLEGQLWSQISSQTNRSYRSSMNTKQDDVVQEAPFTRVEDIESKIIPEEPEPVKEAVQNIEETVEDTVSSEEQTPVSEPIQDPTPEQTSLSDNLNEPTTENTDNTATDSDIPRFE